MSTWKEYKLSDLMEIKYGKDHKHLADGKYPLYGSGGIMRYVEMPLYEYESILIPRKGTLSNLFYLETPFWSVDTMFWSKIKKELVVPKYLYYTLKTFDLASLNVGSAVPSLTTEVLNEVLITIPDLPTQTAIAEILSSLDDKIELNNQINKELEELAQALFKQWFIDFEFPNENGQPYKSSGGKMVESELGEIPKGWVKTPLEKIAKVLDPHPSHRAPTEVEDGLPFAGIGDIDQFGNIDIIKARKVSAESVAEQEAAYTLNAHSIGYGRVGTVGKVVRLRPRKYKYSISPTLAIVQPHSSQLALLTYTLLSSEFFFKKMMEFESGTTRPTIGIQALRKIPFVFPESINDGIIYSFDSRLDGISTLIDTLNEENQDLIKMRDTLLPKLISGELEVSEALTELKA